MLIYLLNYLSVPLYRLVVRNKKKFVALVTCQLFLLLALRAPTLGVDLENYAGGFAYISTLSFGEMLSRLHLFSVAKLVYPYAYESGYVVLNWLVAFFGGNFQTLLAVTALLSMACYGTFIYRHSDCPWLSFCILLSFDYYKYAFGILRQTLAIGLLLLALTRMEERRRGAGLGLIFLAFTMHRASLAFVVLFLFGQFVVTRRRYTQVMIACFLMVFAGPFVFPPLLKKLFQLVHKTSYIDRITGPVWNNYMILLLLITLGIYLLADFTQNTKGSPQNYLMGGFLMALPVGIMGMYSENFGRLGQMFSIMMVVLIPNLVHKQEDRYVRILGKALVFALMLGFMIYTFHGDKWLVPYRSILG